MTPNYYELLRAIDNHSHLIIASGYPDSQMNVWAAQFQLDPLEIQHIVQEVCPYANAHTWFNYLKPQYKFELLRYDELQESRKKSDQAISLAQKALIVAVATGIIQSLLSLIEIFAK